MMKAIEIHSSWQKIGMAIQESAEIFVKNFYSAIKAIGEYSNSLKMMEEILRIERIKKYQGGFYSYMN